jgi:hypothetical protein
VATQDQAESKQNVGNETRAHAGTSSSIGFPKGRNAIRGGGEKFYPRPVKGVWNDGAPAPTFLALEQKKSIKKTPSYASA